MILPMSGSAGARLVEWGIPAMMVVNAAVVLEQPISRAIPRFVLDIGDASYSLYLSHFFVISVVIAICRRKATLSNEWAIAAVCLVASVALSLALYRFCERPITVTLARLLHGTRSPTELIRPLIAERVP